MPNFVSAFKEEVRRLARKEVKDGTGKAHKFQAEMRRTLASLKRRVAKLETENRRLARATAGLKEQEAVASEDKADRLRISSTTIRTLRDRLRLTQADFAKLVGVSAQSIYQWERKGGRLRLRSNTKKALYAIRGLGAREARRRLEG